MLTMTSVRTDSHVWSPMRPVSFCISAALLMATSAPGPAQTSTDPRELIRQFQSSLQSSDLGAAARVAANLDDAVQARYRAFLTRDAGNSVATVLALLPPNTESLFVLQEPLVLNSGNQFEAKSHVVYATERLIALNNGEVCKRLSGRMIRLVVAGVLNMRSRGDSVPGPMPDSDAAYFYFFAEPV